MILEEFLGIFISLLSTCTCTTQSQHELEGGNSPQQQPLETQNEEVSISSQRQLVGIQEDDRSATEETQEIEQQWDEQWDKIDTEYEPDYASLGDELKVNSNLRQSLQKSLLANLGITCAAFLLAMLSMGLVYFELTRQHVCSSNSTFFGTSQWALISDEIEDASLHLWFPATLALLFGWKEFKEHYLSTFYIACAFGATLTIYKCYLFIFHLYMTKSGLVEIGDAMIMIAIICNSFVVARNFCRSHPRPIHRRFHIFAVIIGQFIIGVAFAWIFRYVLAIHIKGAIELDSFIHSTHFPVKLHLID